MSNPPIIRPARLLLPDPDLEQDPQIQAPERFSNPERFEIDRTIPFADRGKIPQVVRDLADFDGNPRNLSQWILDVEDILEIFQDFQATFQYHLIIKTIRRKIKGEANDALITSNASEDWEEIKEVLRLYYSDKRDLMTLDRQLKSLCRGKNESIETYYSKVREMVTLISSVINMDTQWRGHESVLLRLYNLFALDTFIRGLGDPLSRFCKNYKPKSLAQAYNYCVEYLNLDARNAPVNINSWHPVPTVAPRAKITDEIPPVPPRQIRAFNHNTKHVPIAAPRNFTNFNGNQNFIPRAQPNVFAPNRTFVPKQPTPEPMDTSSIRTHQVNYGNRPHAVRRGASDSMRAHDPRSKRMANTLEEILDPTEYQKWYEEQMELNKLSLDESEANETPEEIPGTQEAENEEINFLEEDTEWVAKWFE